MKAIIVSLFVGSLTWYEVVTNDNEFISFTYEHKTDPSSRQLYDFRKKHKKPIGLLSKSSGGAVEIRRTNSLNNDLLLNQYFVDNILHFVAEKIPERAAAAHGTAAFGYFEVTHNVSQYTKADVFNGIGKRTPVIGRFSTSIQNRGGVEAAREPKGMAVKFYTREGNFDLLSLNSPVYLYKDPGQFPSSIHATRRNARTNLFDEIARGDFFTLRFEGITAFLILLSDRGLPNGFRKMDVFPVHTYEIYNSKGEKYYVKFNFRTLQGIENLPSEEAARINSEDQNYFTRDLYNAIAKKKYPSWKLEMDVLTFDDLSHLDYNPFDVTRLWKKGTYRTVTIGRLVYNKNPVNIHTTSEQCAFNPANLIPGISGPKDQLFKGRSLAYPATQNYRLGVNHNKIEVNRPIYDKTYNRDGVPPLQRNMKDSPYYYPNSFGGPIPYVDAAYPMAQIMIYDSNAVDLQDSTYFYNHIIKNDDERDRLANNTVSFALLNSPPFIQKRFIKLFSLIDPDLGSKVVQKLMVALAAPSIPKPRVLIP